MSPEIEEALRKTRTLASQYEKADLEACVLEGKLRDAEVFAREARERASRIQRRLEDAVWGELLVAIRNAEVTP